jgi:hypothetical protein
MGLAQYQPVIAARSDLACGYLRTAILADGGSGCDELKVHPRIIR